MNNRISKDEYYLNIAKSVCERSTCLRRKYGAIIVNNDEIVGTGYNGSPRGCINCNENNICKRQQLCIPKGERYELCESIHAEENAIISAGRKLCIGSLLYLYGFDLENNCEDINAHACNMCIRLIINSGIIGVINRSDIIEWRYYFG